MDRNTPTLNLLIPKKQKSGAWGGGTVLSRVWERVTVLPSQQRVKW